jgi:mono/diheme cytochrome c family protein
MAKRRISTRAQMFAATMIGLAIATVAAGCRSVRRGEPIVGEFRPANASIERGRLVFAQKCYTCHPGGEGGLGPGINDKPLPRFLMKTQVRAGLGAMPSFNPHVISSEELDDLTRYIVALRKQNKPLEDERSVRPQKPTAQ